MKKRIASIRTGLRDASAIPRWNAASAVPNASGLGRLVAGSEQAFEAVEVGVRAAQRGEARGLHVVGHLHLEEVPYGRVGHAAQERAGVGGAAHVRPVPAPHLQDADVHQRADRLADGGTAHAEPRGQVRLRRYALADRPRTPADLRLKLVEHGVDGRTRAHGTQTHPNPLM